MTALRGVAAAERVRARVDLAEVGLDLGEANADALGPWTDRTEQQRRDLDRRPFEERAIEHGRPGRQNELDVSTIAMMMARDDAATATRRRP